MILNPEPLNIIYTSREFQPFSEEFDDTYKFVGPSVFYEESVPPKEFEKREIIYIFFDTVRNRRPNFFRNCIETFKNSKYHIVMSLGKGVDRESLGKIPPGFTIYDFAPQTEILKNTRLFITHGGMNSVHEGLYFEVPLLLFPQTPEQRLIAFQVERKNAGIVIREESPSPSVIKYCADLVMKDPVYHENAHILSSSFKQAGGYKRAAKEIENFCNIQG